MGRRRNLLRSFFFRGTDAPRWRRLLPYFVLVALVVFMVLLGVYVWDYTNSPQFCGTTCHLMPPEYTAYLTSPHARVPCIECHMSHGPTLGRVVTKLTEVRHIVSLLFRRYELPVQARTLAPARETCEQCHYPEKFSDDSLIEIKHFGDDTNNTPTSIFLVLKTGGGSKRQGLGRGIHWHIENSVYYLPLDASEQVIPYVRVVEDDGTIIEYLDVESDIDPRQVKASDLKKMDCISCHNRIAHLIYPPEQAVDRLMARGIISPAIPEIRRLSVELLSARYDSTAQALDTIAGLVDYYQTHYPQFYAANGEKIAAAVTALQDTYRQSVFPEQRADWTTHINEIGHLYAPGCFRCHDGKHLNGKQEAIRLECNLCHSIPIVAGPSDLVARIEVSRGPEPQSHLNANWLALHRNVLDSTCANCHTTANPGGADNSSFCSNSACHGMEWKYAGVDAPALRKILQAQLPPPPTPVPPTPPPAGPLTYEAVIGPLLRQQCGVCHGTNGIKGVDLTTYQAAMAGGVNGPVIIPGNADASLLLRAQATGNHPGQLNEEQLALVRQWIEAGASEK